MNWGLRFIPRPSPQGLCHSCVDQAEAAGGVRRGEVSLGAAAALRQKCQNLAALLCTNKICTDDVSTLSNFLCSFPKSTSPKRRKRIIDRKVCCTPKATAIPFQCHPFSAGSPSSAVTADCCSASQHPPGRPRVPLTGKKAGLSRSSGPPDAGDAAPSPSPR